MSFLGVGGALITVDPSIWGIEEMSEQTLTSIALQMLGTIELSEIFIPDITNTIRRALEQGDLSIDGINKRLQHSAVPVEESPWTREHWCDENGYSWFCNSYSMGRWNYALPPGTGEDFGLLGNYTHSLPWWFIPRPRPKPRNF